MSAIDCFTWVTANGLHLSHGPWELKDHEYQVDWLQNDAPQQCFIKGSQIGAHLSVDTPIPTVSGWTTMRDIKVGEKIFDEKGQICTVTDAFPIEENLKCYKLIFSDNTEIISSDTHKWKVYNNKNHFERIYQTKDLVRRGARFLKGKRARYAIQVADSIDLPDADLLVDPYVLGLWLGDGNSYSANFTCHKDDLVNYLTTFKEPRVRTDKRDEFRNNRYVYVKELYKKLRLIGVLKNKHIPSTYLRSSYDQRLELLRGLIDTDGSVSKLGICEFYNTNMVLIEDVFELVASLGFKPKKLFKGYSNKWHSDGETDRENWIVRFHPSDVRVANFNRKFERQQKVRRHQEVSKRYITDIVEVPSVPVRCVSVDSPSHLYLCSRAFIPTHNTECLVLKTLHGMIHGRYPTGALYLFPTRDDVRDFSKARFDPIIDINPFIGSFVQNTDAQNIKQVGRGFLYLRGARSTKQIGGKKSSSQLKSIPVDRIVFDELDEIEPEMVQLAKERVSHSMIQELIFLGTPTIPEYGIDAMYQKSDQRVWMITCEHCGKTSSLDLEFPACLMRRSDDSIYRGCIYCKGELNPRDGRWIAQVPSKSNELVGWWYSQLNSSRIDPAYILQLYEDPPHGDLSEVMNSKLGRAYIPAENKLNEQDVLACMGQDPMLVKSELSCCMGVDVGRELHVVIGYRPTRESLKIIKVGRYESFNDLHDLAKSFNVRSAVIDLRPETRKVREFQRTENFPVFGCEYIEQRVGNIHWNEKERIVQVNRTEVCDATHEMCVEYGKLLLPRRSEEMNQFAKELCSIAKTLIEDESTGSKVYRYIKLSGRPDHYRHALNYCYLASQRVGVVHDTNIINRFFTNRRKRSWLSA